MSGERLKQHRGTNLRPELLPSFILLLTPLLTQPLWLLLQNSPGCPGMPAVAGHGRTCWQSNLWWEGHPHLWEENEHRSHLGEL